MSNAGNGKIFDEEWTIKVAKEMVAHWRSEVSRMRDELEAEKKKNWELEKMARTLTTKGT